MAAPTACSAVDTSVQVEAAEMFARARGVRGAGHQCGPRASSACVHQLPRPVPDRVWSRKPLASWGLAFGYCSHGALPDFPPAAVRVFPPCVLTVPNAARTPGKVRG